MAIKAIIRILDEPFEMARGEVSFRVFMRLVDDVADGTLTYGPVTSDLVTEAAIVAWARAYMNDNWNAAIDVLDTVKLISGIGGDS